MITIMIIGVVNKGKMTDDDRGGGWRYTKRTVGLERGYTQLQNK